MDFFDTPIRIDASVVLTSLCDTLSPEEEFQNLRPLSYPKTDLFFLCFSIAYPNSFDRILMKLKPEVDHHCPNTPIILLGLKSDLRDDPAVLEELASKGRTCISYEQGHQMAQDIGALKYLECSALTEPARLRHVVDEALRAVLSKRQGSKKRSSGGCQLQ